jgi:hypothetical protein
MMMTHRIVLKTHPLLPTHVRSVHSILFRSGLQTTKRPGHTRHTRGHARHRLLVEPTALRPASFNLNSKALALLGCSLPEPERNGGRRRTAPCGGSKVRRTAVCRHGDGTAIGSGSRTRPGAALPRSRSRGFDPACLRLPRTATGLCLGWLCPPL